jgi:hypothetical protein
MASDFYPILAVVLSRQSTQQKQLACRAFAMYFGSLIGKY